MFEFSITNNLNSIFTTLPENKYGFSRELHDSVAFSNQQINISGIRFKGEKDDFYETEMYLVTIIGVVFYRIAFSPNLGSVGAKELLDQYILNKQGFAKLLKGNFVISIFDKNENSLLLIKDELGLKNVYYKEEKGWFYISTNLTDFKNITNKINYSSVIEKIIFTYPISNESYLEDVFTLVGGEMLKVTDRRIRKATYANIDDFFVKKLPLIKLDKQTFIDIFEKSVLQRAITASDFNVSLTGGFDGRCIIAVLLHHKIKFHSYSFGKQGGENTTVPLNVSKKLGLNYEPIFLDENYEHNYVKSALDTLYFSDGISVFERANYIYSIRKLSTIANYNITGLIGGEIFAPVHHKIDYINNTYFDAIYLGIDYSIDEILVRKGLKAFIKEEVFNNKLTLQKIAHNIEERRKLVNSWKKNEFGWMYYLKDLISLGFRQFYGNQMHLERYYCENLSPFYDRDLIEYLFSTQHIYSYQNAFKNSPLLRRNNRKLQTWIIEHFSKELSTIPVDRGYPPKYTTDIRKLLIPFIFYKRRLRLKYSSPEFDTPKWSDIFYKEMLNDDNYFNSELLNSDPIRETLLLYNMKEYNKTFNQMLSIAIWLKQ